LINVGDVLVDRDAEVLAALVDRGAVHFGGERGLLTFFLIELGFISP